MLLRIVPTVLIAAVALVGCRNTDPQVVVVIDAEEDSRRRGSWLRIVVVDTDGEVVLDQAAAVSGASAEVAWPAAVPLTAKDADPGRR